MEANKIEIKTLIISSAVVLAIELAMALVVLQGLYQPLVLLGAARILQIITIVLIILIWGDGLPSLGLARVRVVPGLKRGLIWSICFGLVAGLGFAGLFFAGFNGLTAIQARLPTQHSNVILYFLVGTMVAPVAEELFFRGMVYGFLRRWGVVVAVILSTLVFVLSHSMNQRIAVTQIVGGIVFAVAYELEGSLMVPITIHVLGNMAILTLSLMA